MYNKKYNVRTSAIYCSDKSRMRTTYIFFIFIFFYLLVIGRLYYIQIHHHAFYRTLATQQYYVSHVQFSPRGTIVDRHNRCLAMNKNYYSAFILPQHINDRESLCTFLHSHFPAAYKRFIKNKDKHFMFIKRKLSQQEHELITSYALPDIRLLSEPGRYYPHQSTAQLIGVTNVDNKGIMGLEYAYEPVLAGNPTTYILEKDARSGHYYFTKETAIQGDEGQALRLTIDAELQFLTHDAIQAAMVHHNAQEGCAIIMNPVNGEILSMVSCPSFDSNNIHTVDQTCRNKIITDTHEFGSVIKVFAALACLEEGVVTPHELIDCRGAKTAYIDGRTINTTIAQGIIPFSEVIAFSNNIGIAIVAKRIGEKLYSHYKKLGFGKKTEISFPGEQSGFVNHPDNWSKHSIISLSYGYELSATLLQLACAFCTIVTGYRATPRLIHTIESDDSVQQLPLYSHNSITEIKNILEKTTLTGTARRARINGYRVMSKTGTAETIVDGKYVHNKNIFTCAGIIEKGTYQRVIIVFIKEVDQQKNVFASTIAAPLFGTIAEQMIIHDGII